MNTCDRNRGQRLLRDELPSAEETGFIQHLDGCPQCRHWLEEDAGSGAEWESARSLLASSFEMVSWTDRSFDSDTLDPHGDVDLAGAARSPHVDISFLSPSDDPASLGRIATYEVTGVIGRGGMGVVFKAIDGSLGRSVAVKVLDPSLAGLGPARQRFAREARAMAAISHEHVLPIYTVDDHRGLPYFAMEYVAGGTLESRLRRDGPLDVLATVRIAMQVAQALAAAHGCGLVHRDIKPANILLDRGTERVRVADFGLARIANDASYTRSGLIAGTPQYMAPEQIRGEVCDARSDLFSLGCVMYAMCVGHPPFRSETVYGAMQRILTDSPRPIREQNANVPAWLAQFIDRLLAKDPGERFDSAADVARLLERELSHLQNPALVPLPAREWIRSERWELWLTDKRRRLIWVAVAAMIVLPLAVLAVWPTGGDRGEKPAAQSGGGEPPQEFPRLRAGVPLWDADGTAELWARTQAMSQPDDEKSQLKSYDPWPGEVEQLSRRLSELDE